MALRFACGRFMISHWLIPLTLATSSGANDPNYPKRWTPTPQVNDSAIASSSPFTPSDTPPNNTAANFMRALISRLEESNSNPDYRAIALTLLPTYIQTRTAVGNLPSLHDLLKGERKVLKILKHLWSDTTQDYDHDDKHRHRRHHHKLFNQMRIKYA